MVEAYVSDKENKAVTSTPIGLIDVYIPERNQTVWIVMFILILSAGTLVAMLKPFNIPIMSRVTMLALSAVLGGAIGSAFNGIRNLFQLRVRKFVASRLEQNEGATIEDLIDRTVSQRGSAWPHLYLQALAQLLPSWGRVGITVRNCPPEMAAPIEPIMVTFEPLALDEADESIVTLEDAIEAQRTTQSGAHGNRANRSEVISELRRIKRNFTLTGGRFMLTIYVFFLVGAAGLSYGMGQVGPLVMMGFLMVLFLFGIPGGGLQSGRKQWLIVPGGIVIREGRLLNDRLRVHLITRKEGVLVVHRLSRYHWRVCAANKEVHHVATVTPHEATLLLRAWLSPLPPPPLERLSDLASN